MRTTLLSLCILLMLALAQADQATFYLDEKNGEDTDKCGASKDKACKTFQQILELLDANPVGTPTIKILPGLYTGKKQVDQALLQDFIIEGLPSDDGKENVTFGFTQTSVFTISGEVNIEIKNIIFQEVTKSPALNIESSTDSMALEFKNLTFRFCSSDHGSAAYVNSLGDTKFQGCTFIDNTGSTDGGALYISGYGHVLVKECNFFDNDAMNFGGAIYVEGGNHTIEDSEFSRNSAVTGGAVFVDDVESGFRFENGEFTFNFAEKLGGAIYVNKGAKGNKFSLLTMSNNSANDGAAVYLANSSASFIDCQIYDNEAMSHGGGIFVGGDQGESSFLDCVVEENIAHEGAGIYCSDSTSEWKGTKFLSNRAQSGDSQDFHCSGSCNSASCSQCQCKKCEDCPSTSGCALSGDSCTCLAATDKNCACNKKDGCEHGICRTDKCACSKGYQGKTCSSKEKKSSSGSHAPVVITVIVCFIVLAAGLFGGYRVYQKRKLAEEQQPLYYDTSTSDL